MGCGVWGVGLSISSLRFGVWNVECEAWGLGIPYLNAETETLTPQPCSPRNLTPHTLDPSPETKNLNPDTPYPTPYTLHPTPYTLHPTPYTLHPTPYTLHLSAGGLPWPRFKCRGVHARPGVHGASHVTAGKSGSNASSSRTKPVKQI